MIDYLEKIESLGIDYKEVGLNRIHIMCPFHDEIVPSFLIYLDSGRFKCYGCHKTGQFYVLWAEITGLSLQEAKKQIMDLETPELLAKQLEDILDDDEGFIEYKNFSVNSFCLNFPSVMGTDGEIYLKNRRITNSTIQKFDLRFANSGKWKNRVIIPVYTEEGKLWSWLGRSILNNAYLKVRNVSRPVKKLWFGLYNLLKENGFKKLEYVILNEGPFDVMFMQQCGFNSIARLGLSPISKCQLVLLKKYTKKVIISYDGDQPGEDAAFRDFQVLQGYLPTFIVKLPDGCDPNELSEKKLRFIYKKFLNT